MDQDESVDH